MLFKQNNLSYCGELVRTYDPDRFLLSMFVQPEVRESLWALFAFNYEIAKTREVVRETMLGQMRLQWWRDALDKIYLEGEVLDNEVLKPLAEAISSYDLPRALFEDLIHAREFDLEGVAPAHLEGLLIYLEHTNKPLLDLVMLVLGEDGEQEQLYTLAMNYGIVGILRAVPFHASQNRRFVPTDLMDKYGVRESHLYEMRKIDGLPKLVEEIAGAYVHGLAPQSVFLRKMSKLADIEMARFKAAGYDYYHPRLNKPAPFRTLRLLLA